MLWVAAAAADPATPRIDIVGGGVAGLTALELLRLHGYDVHLYEKRPLVGGLIGSVAHPLTGEFLGESGPELVNSQDVYLLRLIHRYRLRLSPVYRLQNQNTVFEFGGRVYPYAEFQRMLFDDSSGALAALGNYEQHLQLFGPSLDGMSAQTLLEKCHAGPLLKKFMKVFIWSELGWSLKDLPARSIFDFISVDYRNQNVGFFPSADEGFRVIGGLSQLVDLLRAENAGRIHTNMELTAVQPRPKSDGYRITFKKGDKETIVESDGLIMALPTHQMTSVTYNLPGISELVKDWSKTKYAGTSKVLFWFRGSIEDVYKFKGMGMTDQGFQFWGTEGTNRAGSLLTVYSGALPAEPHQQAQRLDRIKAHLNRIFPGFMDHVMGVSVYNYPQSYIGPVPITLNLPTNSNASLRSLFFIGASFSPVHPGYMDGASNTAFSAVKQILNLWPPPQSLQPCDQMLMAD
jgi:monoamine oxidase